MLSDNKNKSHNRRRSFESRFGLSCHSGLS